MIRTKPANKKKLKHQMLHVLATTKKSGPTAKMFLRKLAKNQYIETNSWFWKAVLSSDYSTAMARADAEQFYALSKIKHKTVFNNGFKYYAL